MQDERLSMQHKELPFIREMFDGIAPRYDFLNRLLSLRQDVVWRKKMVSMLELPNNGNVLDVACGTGDVALEIYRQMGSTAQVAGLDFSYGMLELAKKKIQKGPDAAISLLRGDALNLPFHGQVFDAVTIAFGIRNIQNKSAHSKPSTIASCPGEKSWCWSWQHRVRAVFVTRTWLILCGYYPLSVGFFQNTASPIPTCLNPYHGFRNPMNS
jgi:SAM-dependent methyltransferase